MKKKILHIRKFQDITYFLRRTFRTRTPNFETHPHRLRLRTTTFKINPYRLRLRTTIFKINPYRLRLRTTILKINPYRLRLRTTFFKIIPYRLRLRPLIWIRERNRYGIRLRNPGYPYPYLLCFITFSFCSTPPLCALRLTLN